MNLPRSGPAGKPPVLTAATIAEIVAYVVDSRRLFVVNSERRSIDMRDIADPVNSTLHYRNDLSECGLPNSVTVHHGMINSIACPATVPDLVARVFNSHFSEREWDAKIANARARFPVSGTGDFPARPRRSAAALPLQCQHDRLSC